tara:strand:- start:747 stop:1064 length:318 start_codon:yes stop_codon:yes gene_type:complete
MTQEEKSTIVSKYVYGDVLSNVVMGVDVKSDFYITALCCDIEANLELEVTEVHRNYFIELIEFLTNHEEFILQVDDLDMAGAIQLTASLPCIRNEKLVEGFDKLA